MLNLPEIIYFVGSYRYRPRGYPIFDVCQQVGNVMVLFVQSKFSKLDTYRKNS